MPAHPRSEATRARALDAALALYADDPEAGLNVHAIVRASGVSLGSIYHHFGSMDGLSAALYARCMSQLLDALVRALDGARGARRAIAAVIRAYLAFAIAEPAATRFIHASAYASFLPAHAHAIASAKSPRLTVLQRYFREQVEAAVLAELPDQLVEMVLIGPVAELTRRWLAQPEAVDLDEAARLLPERVWRALRRDVDP